MDNADLESLKLVPGRLNPKFSASHTEYNVLLSSAATQVRVEGLTADSGASYSVKGAEGERTVPLDEGINYVHIEVSAIDGTTKNYTITVTKLAANLAELLNLNLVPGRLDRAYQKKISEYYATLGWAVNQVTVKPVKQDPKMTVDIDGNPPATPVQLPSMETSVKINVLSPDKSTTKVYTLHLLKEDTGYRPETAKTDLLCGVCSSLYQCPRRLLQCSHSFCTVCLAVSQRTDKKCPTCSAPPPVDPPFDDIDSELRDKLLSVEVLCFYCGTGVGSPQLLEHAVECSERLATCPTCEQDVKHSSLEHSDCTASCKLCGKKFLAGEEEIHSKMCLQGESLPNIELTDYKTGVSDWEKKLRVDTSDDFKELYESGEKWEKEYQKIRFTTSDVVEVKKRLESAAHAYANAVVANSKSYNAHSRLGIVLEEIHYVEDLMAKLKKEKVDASASNKEAKDSSKFEEIDAICQLHGVGKTAPLSEKLKAIDMEYHSLKEKGDSFKADRVQELYAWKSKQATTAEKISLIAASDETYLGKAGKKYEDAVSKEPSSFSCNYLLGWSYLQQFRYEEAVTRFRVCIGAKPLLKHVRYLLGIALAKCPGDEHKDEAIGYLKQGVLSYQHWISCQKKDGANRSQIMAAETEFSLYKPQYLRGFIYLAALVDSKEEKRKLLLSVVYLVPRILQTLEQRGQTYKSIEAVQFSAMDKLLSIVEKDEIQTFCKRLSALLSKSPDSGNRKLLELQVETSKKCVVVEASNGQSLTTLGDSLLTLYEMTDSKTLLKESEQCFRAAIQVEGKAIKSETVPEQVKEMQWYKEKTGVKSPPAAAGKGARGGPAKRGAPAARGAARGGAARGGAARGGAAAGKGAARGRGGARGAAAGVARGGKAAHSCVPAKGDKEEKKPEIEPGNESGPVNEKSAGPRLGLARVLSLSEGDNVEERKALYHEVIVIESGLHDAYIELGELCRGTMQAVDVYDKFPFSEELTFDDAYIFGEMVQILMKLGEFDDPRLEKSLMGYGSVMGWNSLESYVPKLENAFKTALLRNVYCHVNKKCAEDDDVKQYFKIKLWN